MEGRGWAARGGALRGGAGRAQSRHGGRGAGVGARRAARLQDGEVRADAEPAGRAAAPPAPAGRAGLPARVGRSPPTSAPPGPDAPVGDGRPWGPLSALAPAPPQVGAAGAEGLPGHRPRPPRRRGHQAEGGGGGGHGSAAVGRGRLCPAPAGTAGTPGRAGWQKLRENPLGKEQATLTLYVTKPKKRTFVVHAAECEGVSPPLKLLPCLLGRRCDFSGDQFRCHSTASPGHLSRGT